MFNKKSKSKQNLTPLPVDGILKNSKKLKVERYKKKYISLFLVSFFLILAGFLILLNDDFILLAQTVKSGNHLVIFQNNAELRPSGGFIGSFAEVTTNNFFLKKLYFESNIYKRDNQFTRENTIIPKDPVLAEFIPEDGLALRDANWSVDFPEAAKSIAWFYKNEGGTDLDSIIAINSDFFKELLGIIGPIDMVKYDLNINSQNFNEVVQKHVEDTYYESQSNEAVSEPKSVLAEMMPIVIVRAKKINNLFSIYKLILKSLKNKNIQIFSFHDNIEKNLLQKKWGGSINETKGDYLSINHANLGANKSSIYIKELIKYTVNESNSSLISELDIERQYTKNEYDKENINFTRVYTPKDSILLKAFLDNTDITQKVESSQDLDKTVFRLWTNVASGKQINIKLIYKLPERITVDNYSLVMQKQSGAINQFLEIIFNGATDYKDIFSHDLIINNNLN